VRWPYVKTPLFMQLLVVKECALVAQHFPAVRIGAEKTFLSMSSINVLVKIPDVKVDSAINRKYQ
jgi:hypothetical protein